ncbi:Protein of unknown function [Micromonospora purpureochromogenes]|uniref:DUF3152 domain-containing protein n=1 Tax=Micromonospora purpureochromogenes TaxID=47872 RepID=A0A1C4VML2_9ACTN|nr:DUF3152 domain-containing protein [Micromonospora purpureochromogenes]SCE85051.1 Protein of unknown function [Micromonospora purpureochromogenes]
MTPFSPLAEGGEPESADPAVRPAGDTRPGLVRMRRRRRRAALLGLVALGATVAGVALVRTDDRPSVPASAGLSRAHGFGEQPAPTAYPTDGSGRFAAADGRSPVRGYGGPLRRYRVAVEEGTGQDADLFADTVDEALADRRSWIASGELRVQRVPEAAAADFTVYLATPATSERLCAEGGLSTEGYTSCRLPGQVIINLARWMDAVPDYGAPLAVYRMYVVNHEVGHELGEEHQACPGPGVPAPVMQQQTYGLDGCVANAWPYVDGVRHEGALVPGV